MDNCIKPEPSQANIEGPKKAGAWKIQRDPRRSSTSLEIEFNFETKTYLDIRCLLSLSFLVVGPERDTKILSHPHKECGLWE